MKTVLLLVCCLLGIGSTISQSVLEPSESFYKFLLKRQITALEDDDRITANVDKYLDVCLETINKWLVLNGMDPFKVEDIEQPITKIGHLSLTHGWMQGLSTVMRSGVATMSYEKQLLNLKFPIAFETVQIDFDYKAKVLNLGPKGDVMGKISNLQLMVDITIDTKTMEVMLQGFKITHSGKITLAFHGNPLIDWLNNLLTGLVTKIFHNLATGVIQNKVQDILQKAIDDINNRNNYYY